MDDNDRKITPALRAILIIIVMLIVFTLILYKQAYEQKVGRLAAGAIEKTETVVTAISISTAE